MIIDYIENFILKIFEKIGLEKIANWYRKHKEGMRYLIFGLLTTIVNILIFAIASKMFNFPTTISNIIAWIIAVLFAYITNKLWVFNSKTTTKTDLAKEIASFFGARIFTLVVETVFLWFAIDKLGFNDIFMKIISNIMVIILNFVLSKIWIFKKEH